MFIGEQNEMGMCAGDIGNAYLEAYTTEKVAFVAGKEFGDKAGRVFVIVRLYGLKSSGARFHGLLTNTLTDMGWFPSKVDCDVWMKMNRNLWEYVATWVDDLLHIRLDSEEFYGEL